MRFKYSLRCRKPFPVISIVCLCSFKQPSYWYAIWAVRDDSFTWVRSLKTIWNNIATCNKKARAMYNSIRTFRTLLFDTPHKFLTYHYRLQASYFMQFSVPLPKVKICNFVLSIHHIYQANVWRSCRIKLFFSLF